MDIIVDVAEILRDSGEVNGLLAIGFLFMLVWVAGLFVYIDRQHRRHMADKEREIKRLARDNHAYRDRLIKLFDRGFPVEIE